VAGKKLKPIPRFESEDEEREFWATHDSTDYLDWSKAVRIGPFPNLKPSREQVTIELPSSLIAGLKAVARTRDVRFESCVESLLSAKLYEETAAERRAWEKSNGGDAEDESA
jgi:hypothetical protein